MLRVCAKASAESSRNPGGSKVYARKKSALRTRAACTKSKLNLQPKGNFTDRARSTPLSRAYVPRKTPVGVVRRSENIRKNNGGWAQGEDGGKSWGSALGATHGASGPEGG
jgi:hypothetical protein